MNTRVYRIFFAVITLYGCSSGSHEPLVSSVSSGTNGSTSGETLFIPTVSGGRVGYSSDLRYIAYRAALGDVTLLLDLQTGMSVSVGDEHSSTFKFLATPHSALMFLSLSPDRSRTELSWSALDKGTSDVLFGLDGHEVHDFCELPQGRLKVVGYSYDRDQNFISTIDDPFEQPKTKTQYVNIDSVDVPLNVICTQDGNVLLEARNTFLLHDSVGVIDQKTIPDSTLLSILPGVGFVITARHSKRVLLSSVSNQIDIEAVGDDANFEVGGVNIALSHYDCEPEGCLTIARNFKNKFRDALFYSGYENSHGRLSWAEVDHIKAISLLVDSLPYLRDDYEYKILSLIDEGIRSKEICLGQQVWGWPALRYSVGRIDLQTFAVLDSIILKELFYALIRGRPDFAARIESRVGILGERLLTQHLVEGGGARVLEDGYLRYPSPSCVPFDGIGVPFNQQHLYAQAVMLFGRQSLTESPDDVVSSMLSFWESHISVAEDIVWPYWHSEGFHGWGLGAGSSVNTPEYEGYAANSSGGYASIDVITALMAEKRNLGSHSLHEMVGEALRQTRGGTLVDAAEVLADAHRFDLLGLDQLKNLEGRINHGSPGYLPLSLTYLSKSKAARALPESLEGLNSCSQNMGGRIVLEVVSSATTSLLLLWSKEQGYALEVCDHM